MVPKVQMIEGGDEMRFGAPFWGTLLDNWRELGVTHTVIMPYVTGHTGSQRLRGVLAGLRRFREANYGELSYVS